VSRGGAPAAAPGDHGDQQRDQFMPVWGDGIQYLYWGARDDRAFDESLSFECLEALGEHLVRDALHHGAVLGEPAGAARSRGQDGGGPLLADQVGCMLDRSAGAQVLGWREILNVHLPKVSSFLKVCQLAGAAEDLGLTDHGGPGVILDPSPRVDVIVTQGAFVSTTTITARSTTTADPVGSMGPGLPSPAFASGGTA
jgi:hypothetical protein